MSRAEQIRRATLRLFASVPVHREADPVALADRRTSTTDCRDALRLLVEGVA